MKKIFLLCLPFFFFSPALAAEEDIAQQQTSSGDSYFAGERLVFSQEIAGDLFAAGKILEISAPVSGDAVVAGQNILFSAPIGDDIRAAAERITIDTTVGDSALLAGQDIVLRSGATVFGDFWATGQEIQILGNIGGNLKISAQKIVLDAEVSGNAILSAEEIVFEKNAKILGSAIIKTNSVLSADDLLRISGDSQVENFSIPPSKISPFFSPFAFLSFFSSLLIGFLALFLAPHYVTHFVSLARKSPFSSFGIGILFLFGAPILFFLLLVSLIGIPFALLLGFLFGVFCVLAKILGGLSVVALLSFSLFSESLSRRFLLFSGATLLLFLLHLIPFVGGLFSFFVFLFTLGVVIRTHLSLLSFLRQKKKL